MVFVRPAIPVDYRLCNQTVTVYSWDGVVYTRRIYTKAFLDFKQIRSVDKTGTSEGSNFLLVIPGEPALKPGDKVLLGEGPEVTTREAWAALIPGRVPGLVVLKYVDIKYWMGKAVHTEAGG